MVEQQLEGDKIADLGLGNLVAAPVLEIQALPSTFFFFSSLLVFFSNGGYPGFSSLHLVVAGRRTYHSPSLMCNVQNDPRS
jgi:hypothetical protein